MTVPAPSLPSVLPGVTIPRTGSGGAASTAGATGFEALLAGLAQGGEQARSPRSAFVQEADAELPAEGDATAQDAVLALMSGIPAPAPIATIPTDPNAGTDGAAGMSFASRQIRVPGFGTWRPAEAGMALPNSPTSEPATPTASRAPQDDPAAPIVVPSLSLPSLDTGIADAGAARTFAATPAADVSAATPSTSPHPSPDAAKAAPASPVAQVQPTPAAPPPTVTQVQTPTQTPTPTLVPPVVEKTAAVTATITPATTVAAAVTASARVTAAPAPAALAEGEPRRTTSAARNERRTESAGPASYTPTDARSDASPVKLAALAATEATASGVDADTTAGDPPVVETPEAADARQPSQVAETRVPAAQAALLTTEAPAARATPETVARFASDVVRKLDGQSTRFDIQLDPYGLGKVDVAIEIDRNGKLTAAMSFDSPQSAADLGNRAADLRLALEQAGFEVAEDGLTFDLAGQGAGFGGREAGQQQERAWNGRAFQRAQSGADETDLSQTITPSPTDRRTRSGVDIRI